jgi:hypothetical protein
MEGAESETIVVVIIGRGGNSVDDADAMAR